MQQFRKELKQCTDVAMLTEVYETIILSDEWDTLKQSQKDAITNDYKTLEAALSSAIDEDYPAYDHSRFKVATKPWQELNPDDLSYWEWLEKVALPLFWQQPNAHLQHKLMAICCALNSSAIPSWNHSARKEAQLPILYFYGESGSGKTEGNKLIAQSYNFGRWALYKADSSGCSLRNTLHQLCHMKASENSWDAHLYPAFIMLDNYEPKFMDKWAEYKVMILSVIRSQSFASIANRDGGNEVFWGHCLKSFTSVVHPRAMDRASSEFYRRFVFFYTAKSSVASMGNYDFSDVPAIYRDLWNVEDVYSKFYPILRSLLAKDDDSTTIPFHRWQQSLVLMATGIYCGLFSGIEEAVDFFTEYWDWIDFKESQTSSSVDIVFSKITNEALDFHYKAFVVKKTIADPYPTIDLHSVLPRLKRLLPEVAYLEKVFVNYLTLHQWSYAAKGDVPYYELRLPVNELYPM